MTDLEKRKSRLVVKTGDCVRDCGKFREVILECDVLTVHVRLKGLKTRFVLPWSAVYTLAARLHADKLRADKKALRARR